MMKTHESAAATPNHLILVPGHAIYIGRETVEQ